MKRKIISLSLIGFCLTGCSLIFGESKPKSVDFGIYAEGALVKSYNATVGELFSITPLYLKGHFLEGFYDAPANGTKYFDGMGHSLSTITEAFPKNLYPIFKSVDELGSHQYQTLTTEEGKFSAACSFESGKRGFSELKNAAVANPDMFFRVQFSYHARDDFSFGTSARSYYSYMSSQTSETVPEHAYKNIIDSSEWKVYDGSFECSARIAIGGTFTLMIKRTSVLGNAYITDYRATISMFAGE